MDNRTDADIDQDRRWQVVKSNDLIQRTRYSLSTQQQRMLLFMISKIKPRDTGDEVYTFDIREFCETAGLDVDIGGMYYETLKQKVKQLADISAWITMPTGEEVLFRWITGVKIRPKSGTISIKFDETVQPYLFGLTSKYTQYRLDEVLPFQSKYAIRLYEVLKSYAFGRQFDSYHQIEHEFTREELTTLLDATTYDRYYDFRKRVLTPAVEEINRYSEKMHVEVIEQKEGRSVKWITFTIDHPGSKQLRGARIAKAEKFNGGRE